MVLAGVMAAVVAGAAGVYFGFVDDAKHWFALGMAVMAAGVLLAFAGGTPRAPRWGRPRVSEPVATLVYIVAVLVLFGAGSVGILFGFTDDWEWAFLLGLVGWAGSVYLVFRGRLDLPTMRLRSADVATPLYVAGSVAALTAGAVGVYFGFAEDSEYLMLLGLAAWAAAVLTTFRGSLAR